MLVHAKKVFIYPLALCRGLQMAYLYATLDTLIAEIITYTVVTLFELPLL